MSPSRTWDKVVRVECGEPREAVGVGDGETVVGELVPGLRRARGFRR